MPNNALNCCSLRSLAIELDPNDQEKSPSFAETLFLVNSKGVNFETFYHELEELSDKLAAMEDQNV